MIAAPIYHRTRPYSDKELYSAIMAYLEGNFVFRKLEIDLWLGNNRIMYLHRHNYDAKVFDSAKSAEELWNDGEFEDWKTCTPIFIKNICSEFILKNTGLVGKGRKSLVKNIVTAEVEHGSLVETVKFNPLLKQLIDSGRQQVKGIKPLSYGSHKRVKVEINEGGLCYFCWNSKNPYIANPAYVFRKSGGSYILIFFSNQHKGSESRKLEINMARFINAAADELGLTPEQAVLQRFC